MMTTNKRILVIGLGAIGSIIAAALKNIGLQVTGITHGPHSKDYIADNGLQIKGIRELQIPIEPFTWDDLKELNDTFDYIFICTKAPANEELAPIVQKQLAPNGLVIIMQNGLGVEDPFLAHLPAPQIARGVLNFSGTVSAPGTVHTSFIQTSYLGYLQENNSPALSELASKLCQGGIPFELFPDIQWMTWRKILLGCPISCISALTGQTIGEALNSVQTNQLIKNLFAEMGAVAAAAGFVYDDNFWQTFIDYNTRAKAHVPSMRGDIENKRRTEAKYTIGYIVSLANKFRMDLPTIHLINNLISAIDEKNA